MTKKSLYTGLIATVAIGCLVYFGFYHRYNYEVHFKPKQHQSVAWFYLISDIRIMGIRGCHKIKEMEGGSRLVNSGWFQCESEVTDDMDALYGGTLKLRDQKEVNLFPNSAHEHYEPTWPQPSLKEAEEVNRQLHDWAMEQYTTKLLRCPKEHTCTVVDEELVKISRNRINNNLDKLDKLEVDD